MKSIVFENSPLCQGCYWLKGHPGHRMSPTGVAKEDIDD